MDGLEIRRAVPRDKDAVIGIRGGVYDGLDYLEDYYDEFFMNDPNTTSYVAVYHGEIVAFLAAYVNDGGNTIVSRAGRVKPDLTGRGIYKTLHKYSLGSSGACVNAFTALNTHNALSTDSFQKEYRIILTRPMTRYDLHTQSLKKITGNDVHANQLKILTESLLRYFISNTEHKQYFFPNERIVSNWIPYNLLQSNVPLIMNGDRRTLRLTNVRSHGDTIQGLLTMSKIYTGANGATVCVLDIYGTDDVSLRRHLSSQLNFLYENSTGDIVILILIDTRLDISSLKNTFQQMCGQAKTVWRLPDDPESIHSAQFVLENVIKVGLISARLRKVALYIPETVSLLHWTGCTNMCK